MKVSIIIATYNRAAFIEQTLISIANQSFGDFECIVVDDGSTDHTNHIVTQLALKDSRFKYVPRPSTIPKGANYSRNYGYSICTGDLIKFFDSDDLMLPQHLEISVNHLEKGNFDFVVGDCINFDESGLLERPYEIDRSKSELTAINFVKFNTAWITDDLLVKREFTDKIEFAAGMRDQASEYYFNIKLLLLTTNGLLIDQIITHRRLHDGGIVVNAQRKKHELSYMGAEMYLVTAQRIESIATNEILKWLLKSHIQESFNLASARRLPTNVITATPLIVRYFGLKGIFYPLAIMSALLTGKGYIFMKSVYQ